VPPKTGYQVSRFIDSAIGAPRSVMQDEIKQTPKLEANNRPLTDMWYPGLSDFRGMLQSDFEERYEAKLKERQGSPAKKKRRADTQMIGA
jgi:hypothetical protein